MTLTPTANTYPLTLFLCSWSEFHLMLKKKFNWDSSHGNDIEKFVAALEDSSIIRNSTILNDKTPTVTLYTHL